MGNTSKKCSMCGGDIGSADYTHVEGIMVKARFCCRDCKLRWMEKNGK